MVACVTHEQVLSSFQKEGYTLLSQYKSAREKLDYICPQGHKHSISWNSFKSSGCRCPYCKGLQVQISDIEKAFADRGYKLLSKYEKSNKKLDFICPSGHQHSILWSHFRKGHGCGYCAKRVINHSEVEKAFATEGYILLDKFNRSNQKIRFICPKGHRHQMAWNNFRSGNRCGVCSGQHVIPSEISKAFRDAGYTLISDYINSEEKLKFICPNGHEHSILWTHFRRGHRCAYCAGSIVLHEQVEQFFNANGYTLLSQYVNHKEKLLVECPDEHVFQMSWNQFQQGGRCTQCLVRYRTPEDQILKKISSRIRSNIKMYLQVFRGKSKICSVKFKGKSKLSYDLASAIYKIFGDIPSGANLDHIVPQSFFDLSKEKEILACWSVENLRYLPKKKNCSRGNRLTLEEVQSFSDRQLEILNIASRKPKKWAKYLNNLNILPT